jgi:hypothetical protein
MFLPDDAVRPVTLSEFVDLNERPQPTTFGDAGGIPFTCRRLDR